MRIKFDDISVPTERLDFAVGKSLYEIKQQYKKKKRRIYLVRGAAAAAVVLAAAGIFVSNPVLAAKLPLIGHIFERVQYDQRYPGNFDEVAKPVNEGNSDQTADPATMGNVSASQGITMTLSEIYCDSMAMYVTAMIESEEPFPEKVMEPNIYDGYDYGHHMTLWNEQEFDFVKAPSSYEPYEWPGEEYEWTQLDLKGEFVDEHTFVGEMRIDFSFYPIAGSVIPDTFHWKLKVDKMHMGYDSQNLPHFTQDGTWEFNTEVSVDQAEPRVVEVNESGPNGAVIRSVTMTNYEVVVEFGYDESRVMEGFEQFDSVQSVMLDAAGKKIIDKIGMFSPVGYDLSKITVYFFPTPDDETYMAIQDKLYDETFQDQLTDYLEEISIQKIEIDLAESQKPRRKQRGF